MGQLTLAERLAHLGARRRAGLGGEGAGPREGRAPRSLTPAAFRTVADFWRRKHGGRGRAGNGESFHKHWPVLARMGSGPRSPRRAASLFSVAG